MLFQWQAVIVVHFVTLHIAILLLLYFQIKIAAEESVFSTNWLLYYVEYTIYIQSKIINCTSQHIKILLNLPILNWNVFNSSGKMSGKKLDRLVDVII